MSPRDHAHPPHRRPACYDRANNNPVNDSCLFSPPLRSPTPPAPFAPPVLEQQVRIDGWLGLIIGPLLLVAVLVAAIWAGHGIYTERERNLAIRFTLAQNDGLARLVADRIAARLEHDIVEVGTTSAGSAPAGTMVATLEPAPTVGIDGDTLTVTLQSASGTGHRIGIDTGSLLAGLDRVAPGHPGIVVLYDHRGRSTWRRPTPPGATASVIAAIQHPPPNAGVIHSSAGGTVLVGHAEIPGYGLHVRVVSALDEVLALTDGARSNMRSWGWSLTIALSAAAVVLVSIAYRQRRLCHELVRASEANSELVARLRDESSRAYQLASHDHLTGLPNRMLFSELANSHLSRAKRSHSPFVMMFLDLDRFKRINDTLGHRIGDLLLQEVANRLRGCVRATDIVARLGGDEFVLLLTELDTIDDASRVARKLIETIAQPMVFETHEIEVRPSIGISIHPRDGTDVETMMRNADTAMYEAKRTGSGCFHYYDPSLNSRSSLQLDLSGRFRRAILGNEFVLHYQPRVALNGFRVTSLEALIRWQHPQRGLVPPGEFIEYAEQEGLVIELGNWVVREACRQIAAWLAEGLDVVPIAINVSPKQLRDQRFVDVIRESVAHYGIRPELLEIEITERCVVEDFERPRAALETLSALGLKIALDDYGTGFSSLSYLKRLPIDIIKIDRSFISDIRNQTNDAAIVASTIALGHNLGLTVIAEGVETREQVIYLRTAGCDEVQGYYFHKPAAADAIRPLLEHGGLGLPAAP